jgi:D-hydantoinase
MLVDTVIKGGTVVTTEGRSLAAIAIDAGKIVAVTDQGNAPQARRTIDVSGKFVLPGLVDAHMHLNYPQEDMAKNFRSETQAAAAGGCTTVINVMIEHGSGSIVEGCEKYAIAFEKDGYVDLSLNAFVCTPGHIREMQDALNCGISSFKFLLPYKGREAMEGLPGIDDGILYLGFAEISRLVREGYRTFARVHAESIEVYFRIEDSYRERGIEPKTYTEVRPNIIEFDATQRTIAFAKETGCPVYIVHMTIKEGPPLIGRSKLDGVDIMAETCPQYLVLNTENTDKLRSKVNPPVRHREDNEALWQALKDGIIQVVGTDHAPVTEAQRGKDFWRAHVGMAGIETWLPIMLSEGVGKGRMTLERVVEVCCYNPAKKYGLTPQKGTIAVGSDADLVIVDLEKKLKVEGKNLYTQAAGFYNYEGWEFKGWPVMTILRGNVIMEGGKVTGPPGFGKFIPVKTR